MVVTRMKLLIIGLPFDSKGYERPKKLSVIVNAHAQRIMQLPVVYGTNPKKVYDSIRS